jgi:hypothetical protein
MVFFYIFLIHLKNIKLIYEYLALYLFIVYIHMECLLTFRYGITIYKLTTIFYSKAK